MYLFSEFFWGDNHRQSSSCTCMYVTYEFKFCKAKLNFLLHRRKFKFLNSNIARLVHCKGQVIIEYCHMWFMNSDFSLHKVSRYWLVVVSKQSYAMVLDEFMLCVVTSLIYYTNRVIYVSYAKTHSQMYMHKYTLGGTFDEWCHHSIYMW